MSDPVGPGPGERLAAERLEYAIAHDLRTPLRAICSTASILVEELGPHLDEGHRKLLERQAFNASRFGRLLDDLLDYSRLSRGQIDRQAIDLTALSRRIGGELIDVQEGMAVDADPHLVETMLRSLVDNARKFSLGGVAHIRQEGEVISVSDEGIGFEPSHAARIFRPFERLVGEEYPGTGIGLALAERIVERHGGRIWAQAAPGRGATFSFTLAPGRADLLPQDPSCTEG